MLEREPDLECCGIAQCLDTAREGVAATSPHLLVTDLRLGHGDTVTFIKLMRAEFPSVGVLVVTDYDAELYASRVLAAGASGFAQKCEPPDRLLAAVRVCASGGIHLDGRLTALLVRSSAPVNPARPRRGVELLSNRELEVFRSIGDGMSTKQIAEAMALSVKTVETHRTTIKRKLGLNDGVALMRSAMRWTIGSP